MTTGAEERDAALAALATGYLSLFEGSYAPEPPFSFWGGPFVQQLESEWAAAYGARHAVSVNSATSGLYASIGALRIGFGDEVIVSPYTMSACAVCALIYGAIPVFADVTLDTGSLDPDSVRRLVSPRTRAIVVVHQFGIPADMDAIMSIAREHNIAVIEDCAQAHGARFRGQPVGTIGDIGVFSLNVNKTIQSGEGGVCVTNDDDLRYRLALIRNHGEAVVGPAGYEDITNILGFNYRMTELTAAVASAQLRRLGKLNAERLELVAHLNAALGPMSFLKTPPACVHEARGEACQGCFSTYYVYPLRVVNRSGGVSRDWLAAALRAEGIPFGTGYVQPLYLQPLYQRRQAFKHGYPFTAPENASCLQRYEGGTSPNAERLHFNDLMINEFVRPPHTADDIDDIAIAFQKLESAMDAATETSRT